MGCSIKRFKASGYPIRAQEQQGCYKTGRSTRSRRKYLVCVSDDNHLWLIRTLDWEEVLVQEVVRLQEEVTRVKSLVQGTSCRDETLRVDKRHSVDYFPSEVSRIRELITVVSTSSRRACC